MQGDGVGSVHVDAYLGDRRLLCAFLLLFLMLLLGTTGESIVSVVV